MPRWFPTYLETSAFAVLSTLQKLSDEVARKKRDSVWYLSVWVDGPCALAHDAKGAPIINLEKAIKDLFQWKHVPKKEDSTKGKRPFIPGYLVCSEAKDACSMCLIASCIGCSTGAQRRLSSEWPTTCCICSGTWHQLLCIKRGIASKRLCVLVLVVCYLCTLNHEGGVSHQQDWNGCVRVIVNREFLCGFHIRSLLPPAWTDDGGPVATTIDCHLSVECAKTATHF